MSPEELKAIAKELEIPENPSQNNDDLIKTRAKDNAQESAYAKKPIKYIQPTKGKPKKSMK